MNMYENYSKEDLIREIKQLKQKKLPDEKDNIDENHMFVNLISLRKTMSEVLSLLLRQENDDVIDQALLLILRFFKVDRVYIGILDEENHLLDFTHEVTSSGIVSMREDILRKLPTEEITWWVDKIKNAEHIIVNDVSQMPEDAAPVQYLLQMQNIASLLALPVVCNGKSVGFIGLDAVETPRVWNSLDIENLLMFADIVSIAIEQEHSKFQLEYSAKLILKSEAKFRLIFEKLPWGVELYDEEGNLLDLNNADLDIFGTTRDVIGVNIFQNPNIPEWVKQKQKQGEDVEFSLDYNFVTVKNTGYYQSDVVDTVKHLLVKAIILKDLQEQVFGYLYIVYDNTENHHKAEVIQDNLAKLKVAVDTGESFMWEYTVATEKLTVDFGLNDDLEKSETLSYIKEQQPTCLQDFISTLHPEDIDKVYYNLFRRLINGEINNYVATYRRILNGRLFWFNSNVRAYKFNEDGTPSKIVSYTSNITKQREGENELIRIKEADKLKSAFLANMSHEIRTPLNAIVGFSDIAAETNDADERRMYLNIIHKNNDLLLHLIDDILDFSKIEAGTFNYHITDTNIKEICGEIYLANLGNTNPDVKLLFDQNLPSIHLQTDPQRITQVIANFVNNAIKFTEDGSITLSYNKEGDHLRVSVSDTGIGISEKDANRIFERFIKVNDFKPGTGLGLTISKTIIESLGGKIGVTSKADSGSTFWFTLPLGKEQDEDVQAPNKSYKTLTHREPSKEKSILVAEDTVENYKLMDALLGKTYTLYHAWNGQEAVDLYKEKQPNLILMDIRMPVMDGFEAACKIRELSETVPIVALTAFAFEKERKMAEQCRFTNYVVKPVEIAELEDLIRKMLIIDK